MNTARRICLGLVVTAVLSPVVDDRGLAAAAATATDLPRATAPRNDPFPTPAQLEPAIRFWQQCFVRWRRNEIALHDAENLGIVYEVFKLPGFADEQLTSEQRNYVDERRRSLADQLDILESRIVYQVPLDTVQHQLLDTITRGAGRSALFGAGKRVRSQRGMRERFKAGVARSGRFDALMRHEFRRHGLPEDLALLPHVESSFQAYARSSVGAAGVWQFMPGTAKRHMRMNHAIDERYDPVLAAQGAADYLAEAYERLQDWGLAITSYNHGVNGMEQARFEHGRDIGAIVRNYHGPAFGFSSRNFYAEFLAVREILHNPAHFYPEGVVVDSPLQAERVRLPRAMRLTDLTAFYHLTATTLTALNPAFTQATVMDRSAIPAYSEVWLPAGVAAMHAPLATWRPTLVAWDRDDSVYENEPRTREIRGAHKKHRRAARAQYGSRRKHHSLRARQHPRLAHRVNQGHTIVKTARKKSAHRAHRIAQR